MIEFINKLDISILNFIRDNLSNPIMDKIMIFITSIGDLGLVWILLAISLLFVKKYRKIGFLVLLSLLLANILGELILKNIVQRPRAFLQYPGIEILIKAPTSYFHLVILHHLLQQQQYLQCILKNMDGCHIYYQA